MSLPVDASVQAAQSFARDLRSAHAFMVVQDAESASSRHEALLAQLNKARDHLRWNPAAGRPARLLQLHSTQGHAISTRAKALASTHGLPELRELVIKPYVLLYAHGADRVVLLALRHERQLIFRLD